MSRYRFDLAHETDEPNLRRVMSSVSMPGSIEIAFEREPNYFRSNCVLGPDRQTIICRDTYQDNQIVGLATRSVRDMYYLGGVQRIGYLGSLRLVPSARSQSVLARGYRFVRELHEADSNPPAFYFTTIAEGNKAATQSLTTSRADLPRYRRLTTLHTLAIPRRQSMCSPEPGIEARQPDNLSEVIDAMRTIESDRHLAPAYTAADFEPGGTFDGLNTKNTVMITNGGQLAAIAGTWDQRHLRQSVVRGYSSSVRLLRPFHNLFAAISHRAPLPKPGRALELAYLAFPWVRDSRAGVFRFLLEEARSRLPATVHTLLAGFCANDPLLTVAKQLAHFDYKTTVYTVSWDNKPGLDQTAPYYLELGCL